MINRASVPRGAMLDNRPARQNGLGKEVTARIIPRVIAGVIAPESHFIYTKFTRGRDPDFIYTIFSRGRDPDRWERF